MSKGIWIAVLAVGGAIAAGGELRAQGAAKSTWDGVYTAAQAERGQAAYTQNCASCHGPELAGAGEAKPLAGPEFLANWNGLPVGDLYDRIRTTMPMDRPGALSGEDYADTLAYMLKFNGFPAGGTELDKRSEVLAGIRIDTQKPTGAAVATGAGKP